jgi:ElaB/YqjD/DUF883 family membrane-anchored ribosome-binding protein
MSKQRSTQSTSGRSSQTSTTRDTATTTTQDQTRTGGQNLGQSTAQGRDVVDQTKQKAQELSSQMQQKATQRVESGLAKGKSQAAETLNTVAQSLVVSGQQLRERNQEGVSRFVDQTADRVQRVSNYLQNTDVSEIVDRTEDFARRRPALFLGGAFALGLLGARFLKSSRRQQEQRAASAGYPGAGTPSGQKYSRERGVADQEVPTRRPQDEWAAAGADVGGLADVAGTGAQTQPLGEPGFGRQKAPIDYGIPPGGPEAPPRL